MIFERKKGNHVPIYYEASIAGYSSAIRYFIHRFSLIHIAPYDVIDSITTPNMTQEQIDLLRQRYGLDQPFLVQYFLWIKNILTGNLGFSLVSQNSIAQELAVRIPNTIRLVLPAYLTALLLAILLGLLAAANKGKVWDRLIDGIASLGIAVPTFWFAMILIYLLGIG